MVNRRRARRARRVADGDRGRAGRGRTAVAVERLRAKWRAGRLPAGLVNQVPPPARTTQRNTRSRG
ncbi:hypothetical protein I553_10689 [Mycobacterium xenopi 4042]|uniref:Uncharacterized protein n=1 Tax=Mycobacterium xenopi 4042 TaxID=1299334 RepID=X8D9V1_MYCXE|nr:hypothetical protein I553_10689 [Mycobacterium xenopi 4042]